MPKTCKMIKKYPNIRKNDQNALKSCRMSKKP